MRTDSAMRGYDPIVDSRRKQSHLAQLQGVSKAVLPVHTHRERALFSNLMQRHPAFNTGTAELNWKEAIRVWNRIADQDDQVFYKLTEQLRAYLTKWKVNANIKNTESGTREDRSRVDDLVKNIDMTIPEVPRRHEQPNHTAPNGHRFPHGNEGSPSLHHHSSVLPGTPCHPNLNPTAGPSSSPPEHTNGASGSNSNHHTTVQSVMEAMSRKRVRETYEEREPAKRPKKAPRKCWKCGSFDCKGRKTPTICPNPCQDCSRLECRGRNSRRPTKKCDEAWD
ncbi:hypothetical protein DFP72DRAFT_529407 [Ephemerocybe angulata]|uniref:Uncharacterized protein n=1 Tax=Ephemerocybe angulata TaxID=980116 RepID=A0A8H6MCE5_9AGAR|nr:hypothetical protein DFP72DRAFT_529407 [Tulosesus angulatus]